jgi:hypothetical protein
MGILCMSENPLGMDTGAVSRPGDRAVTAA